MTSELTRRQIIQAAMAALVVPLVPGLPRHPLPDGDTEWTVRFWRDGARIRYIVNGAEYDEDDLRGRFEVRPGGLWFAMGPGEAVCWVDDLRNAPGLAGEAVYTPDTYWIRRACIAWDRAPDDPARLWSLSSTADQFAAVTIDEAAWNPFLTHARTVAEGPA